MNTMKRTATLLLLSALSIGLLLATPLTQPLRAQDPPSSEEESVKPTAESKKAEDDLTALKKEVQEQRRLSEELRKAMKEKETMPTAPVTGAQTKDSALTAGWDGEHPFIRSTDGNFLMQFGGRIQLDWRNHTADGTTPPGFVIRRARIGMEGKFYRHYEYKIEADIARNDVSDGRLRAAYLNINYSEPFQVQAGQFKAPFSQEELQSSKYIDFVERSSANNLTPSYNPGVMVHGGVADHRMNYQVGVFMHRKLSDPVLRLGSIRRMDRPEIFVRLQVTPYRTDSSELTVGGAASNGSFVSGVSNPEILIGATSSRSILFFPPQHISGGDIQRYNGEFWLTHKNFSLRGEYLQDNQFREGRGTGGTNLPGIIGKGYVLQATYLLTGEKKTRDRIKPAKNFLGESRGPGAWELAFRFDRLQLDNGDQAGHTSGFTAGVNWWLNDFVRYQANFISERVTNSVFGFDGTKNFSHLSRMQVFF